MAKNLKASSLGKHQQYAALPIRVTGGAGPEVLLVTSRATRRWVIPKGWPMKNRSASEAAEQEAYEEAGVKGEVGSVPIGRYSYEKRLNGGGVRTVYVDVFLLTVSRQLAKWPEKAERQRLWCAANDAAERVAEPELAAILRALATPPGR